MTIEQIKQFLRDKPGYLRKGSGFMSKMLDSDIKDCRQALRSIRKERSKKEDIKPSSPQVKIAVKEIIKESGWSKIKSWFKNLFIKMFR